MPSSRRTTRTAAVLAALVAAVAMLAACTSTTSSGAPASSKAKASNDPVVKDAKQLVKLGTAGVILADKPEDQITYADWKSVDGWVGPPNAVKPAAKKKIYSIACASAAPFCDQVAKGTVEAAKAIGWDATYLDGKGTPQGFATAFATAIAAKPDAIVTMALPESVVGEYIKNAHQAGIKVIGLSSIPESGTPKANQYDAYMSTREDSNAQLDAWYTIASSEGKAQVGYLWDPAYPFLTTALASAKKVFAQCKGCKILKVLPRQLSTAADPAQYQAVAQSLIQQNPTLTDILLPYGLGTPSIINAVRSSGKNIQVVNKNADPINLDLVHQGSLAFEVGTSPTWAGWAGLDQTIRVLAGQQPLEDWQENLPIHMYVPSNTSKAGEYDWDKYDFKGHYLQLWGKK